jgi:serine/threonine-protein kinase
MIDPFRQISVKPYDRETVEQPVMNTAGCPKVCCPKKGIIDGSSPHLTSETQTLLHTRLRAASRVLLIGFAIFLIRHTVGVLTGEPFNLWFFAFHVVVVVVLSSSLMLFQRHQPLPMNTLRVFEVVVFGLPVIFFITLQHRVILLDADRAFLMAPMSLWPVLIFTYGMFIPNQWTRAALVIGGMAIAPVLHVFAMTITYPHVAAIATSTDLLQHIFVMLISAIAAIVGTHLINTLRQEAFEARQLGQYRLMSQLGSGGMGEVYLAEHRMLKRPCAIKLIHPSKACDPRVLARFEREVQMTARLSHWNTVEIYDYGRTDDGTFYYVMEYLPGLSLEDLLDRHGPLPAERAVHLLRQSCHGLREAHAIGLIHRDIKPANIFVAERGGVLDVVKILDFGLVKPVSEIGSARLTQEGSISGTPLFMSPEQAQDAGEVDARSDIYSLGAVAYTMLCGRPPFERDTPLEVMIAHARDEVVPLKHWRADVPADLELVILCCLSKRPDDRYPDIESLESALSQCDSSDRWDQANAARCWREMNATPKSTWLPAATLA